MPWVHVRSSVDGALGVICNACAPPRSDGQAHTNREACVLKRKRQTRTISLTRADVPDHTLVYRADHHGRLDALFPIERMGWCPIGLRSFIEWFWLLGANGDDLARIVPSLSPAIAAKASSEVPLGRQPLPPPLCWVRHEGPEAVAPCGGLLEATREDEADAETAWKLPRSVFCPLRGNWLGPALAPRWTAVCGETSLLYVWGTPTNTFPDGAALLAKTEVALLLTEEARVERLPVGHAARRAMRAPALRFDAGHPEPGEACLSEGAAGWCLVRAGVGGPASKHLMVIETEGVERVVARASVRRCKTRPPDGFFGTVRVTH